MPALSPVTQKFVLHWGEMGTRWGVNRTVAQIHALLFIKGEAMHAEAIAETLGVARSNVSTSIKELQGWGIVRVVHKMGDRRDHFETEMDVWEGFRLVMDERKRREIDPTMRLLHECLDEIGSDKGVPAGAEKRVGEMLVFFETTSRWYEQMRALPKGPLVKVLKAGSKLGKVLGV